MSGDGFRSAANFAEALITYNLTASSTSGGSVAEPGEATYTYGEGTIVDLLAVADTGYTFVNWTGDTTTIADPDDASTTITINGDYGIMANFVLIE